MGQNQKGDKQQEMDDMGMIMQHAKHPKSSRYGHSEYFYFFLVIFFFEKKVT